MEGGGNMVILVYPNVRNVVVSGQWENNCSNNVPDVLINTQIINTFSSGVLYFGASFFSCEVAALVIME